MIVIEMRKGQKKMGKMEEKKIQGNFEKIDKDGNSRKTQGFEENGEEV